MMRLLLALTALLVVATGAQAAVLWDQSDYDALNQLGMWDAVAGCAPFGGSVHYAQDFRVHDHITIHKITTWYTAFNFDTASAVEAYLYVAPKVGPLPIDGVDLPQENGTLIPITVTTDPNGFFEIVADGLSIPLGPGDYWVSLTPILPEGGFFGPDFHLRALTNWGHPSAWYEYCGQFAPAWGVNVDGFDASIRLEGSIDVVPTESASWGHVKALY